MTFHREVPFPEREALLEPERGSEFTLREFLSIVFKDRWRITAGFFIPMIVAIIISFLPTPRYEAVSTVLVRMGREFMYRPEVGESNIQPIAADRQQSLHSEVEILNSRDLIETAIEKIGLAKLYPAIAALDDEPNKPRKAVAILELQKRLDVLLLKDSNVIQVAFKHPDPQIGAQLVNQLIENYLEKRRMIFSDPKLAFAENQVKTFRQRLTDEENAIAKFKKENNIVSYSDQQRLLLGQRDGLEIKLNEAKSVLASVRGRLAATNRSLGKVVSEIPFYTEATVDHARAALVDLRIKETDVASKYLDKSSVLADLRANIASMETYIHELESKRAEIVRLGRSPARDSIAADVMHLNADLNSAEATVATLAAQFAAINDEIEQFSKQELALDNMMRDRQLLDSTYQSYVKKLEEAHVTDDLDRKEKTNVSIVQVALPPIEKKNLQPLIIAAGFVLSVTIALFVALITDLLRGTFLSPEKMQRSLGIPVLATIPLRTRKAVA